MYFIILVFCFISSISFAAEYKILTVGTEAISAPQNGSIQWTVKGINDKGQMFGGYIKNELSKEQKNKMYIVDKNGITLVDSNDPHRNYHLYYHYSVMNNAGQIVGLFSGDGSGLFISSRALGFRPLDVPSGAQAIALNDLGQLIVTAGNSPFLWDNGILTEMGIGSEFAKSFEILGYYIMDISLTSINNRGQLAGYFCYGKYNEKQKKFTRVGYKVFFWDGQPSVIPLPIDIEKPLVVKVNNHGVLLIRDAIHIWDEDRNIETTFLWDIENGLQLLPDFYGESINDSSVILGFEKDQFSGREIAAIWKNGTSRRIVDLLGVSSLGSISPPYSDTFSIEKIHRCLGINNKNQIACEGYIWGEIHPCILEPVNFLDHTH